MLELALVRWALEKLRGHGFEPVIPPVLVRERALFGTGFLPDTEQQIYTPARRRAVPRGHLRGGAGLAARRRDHRRASACRCATPASRPASAARRAPPARTRAASSACTSSTRSRCSASSRPRTRRRSTSASSRSRRRSSASSALPYRVVNIAVGELGSSAAKKYDCEAWLPSQAPLPRADVVLEHDRLPGAAPEHPRARAKAGTQHAAHAQRHRRRGRAHDRRAARERPARGRRAWICPPRWCPTVRPRGSRRPPPERAAPAEASRSRGRSSGGCRARGSASGGRRPRRACRARAGAGGCAR